MPWNGSHVMAGPVYMRLVIPAYGGGWSRPNIDWRCCLFNDTITPDPGLSGGGGAIQCLGDSNWPITASITNAPGWPGPFGLQIPGQSFTEVPDEIRFSGSPVTSSAAVTMAGIFGDMVCDHNTIYNPGDYRDIVHCYHEYGGQVDVTTGLLTIMWDMGGIMAMVVEPPPGAPPLPFGGRGFPLPEPEAVPVPAPPPRPARTRKGAAALWRGMRRPTARRCSATGSRRPWPPTR
jgi:hypothetical protein